MKNNSVCVCVCVCVCLYRGHTQLEVVISFVSIKYEVSREEEEGEKRLHEMREG